MPARYGADAVCPQLALETWPRSRPPTGSAPTTPTGRGAAAPPGRAQDGVLKVMAKMGIADIASYRGAQLFERSAWRRRTIGSVTATPSPLGVIGFAELERELRESCFPPDNLSPGYVKYRPGGEPHATTPEVAEALQAVSAADALRRAVHGRGGVEEYRRFAALVDGRTPLEPRDLLELVPAGPPVPLDEVELAEATCVASRAVACRGLPLRGGARDGRDRLQPPGRTLELRRGR